MERKDILAVVEKYKVYFELWNVGIAEGVKGDNVFYVINENDEVELFMTFKTSQQLEAIILGTLAENMTCMLSCIPENLYLRFRELEIKAAKEHYDVTDYFPLLLDELACIREEFKEWSQMMEVTFKPLKALECDSCVGGKKEYCH